MRLSLRLSMWRMFNPSQLLWWKWHIAHWRLGRRAPTIWQTAQAALTSYKLATPEQRYALAHGLPNPQP